MGLGFSHCQASWSCRGFKCFRERLFKLIDDGELLDMDGFYREPSDGTSILDPGYWEKVRRGTRSWNTVSDPITILLRHSDCEGELTPQECRMILPRLTELASELPEGDYDRENATELAAGMARAIGMNQPLEFH